MDRRILQLLREMDEYELRRLIIYAQGLLVGTDGPVFESPGTADEDPVQPARRYRQQMVKCGKKGCTRCPHGPYWYAYWREGGKVRTQYIGKELPEGAEP